MIRNTKTKVLPYLFFALLITVGFAFTNASTPTNVVTADTSTLFTDYFFPDPKKKDGKRQFVKKLCWESAQVEDRIKEIIDDFKGDKGYKKNKIGRNPDVGWHRKTGELIFRNAEDHKKTYAPKLDKDATEGKGVKISTFGDCK